MKYQIPSVYHLNNKAKFKVLNKQVKHQGQGHKLIHWFPMKGSVTRNINVKCHSHSTYHSKDIAKVKSFQ